MFFVHKLIFWAKKVLKYKHTPNGMKKIKYFFLLSICLSCLSVEKNSTMAEEGLEHATNQYLLLLKEAEKTDRIPRTISKSGEMHWANESFDWTEGFFPGTLWYLYEYSDKEIFKNSAKKFQSKFESHKLLTNNHDLGFIFNSSYGNALKIINNEEYKNVIIEASNSLIQRFNPKIGSLQSWDVDSGWQAKRGWEFPVIIDNMMNLELLFEASELTGNEEYKNIAITHAETTLKNHFRPNNSSYHLVDYDPENGQVRSKETAQGYSDDSSWARGQAWGLYGYTVCYRYTKDERFLDQAEKIADYIIANTTEPNQGIPYWDYDAPKTSDVKLDVSAATITASALLELSQYSETDYAGFSDQILKTLQNPKFTTKAGESHNFILKHSVGSIPHNAEIDVPLNYADYYYVEALLRKHKGLE